MGGRVKPDHDDVGPIPAKCDSLVHHPIMIDNISILLSLGAIVFVLMRAVVLDKTRPWFGTTKTDKRKPLP